MASIEEGRKCVITKGRRAGEEVTVSKLLDGNMVMIKGKKKERKISIKHLEPKE